MSFDPKAFAQELLESEDYQDWLRHRISTHSLDPRLEKMLWEYGGGKPPARLEVSDVTEERDLHELSDEELLERHENLVREFRSRRSNEAVH